MTDTHSAAIDAASLVDDPADLDLMQEILGEGLDDLAGSNWKTNGVAGAHAKQSPLNVSLESLPPDARPAIQAQVQHMPPGDKREAETKRLVAAHLRVLAGEARLKTGANPDREGFLASERLSIEGEIADLRREEANLIQALSEVVGHKTEVDPKTGKAEAVPIMRVTGDREAAYSNRIAEIARHIAQLEGPEADTRLAEAARKELARRKQLRIDAGILPEARKRAVEIAQERRVNELAERLANREFRL